MLKEASAPLLLKLRPHTGQEFLSLGDGTTKHRIFIHYSGWSGDRWDSWVDARCRCARLHRRQAGPSPIPHGILMPILHSRVEHTSDEAVAAMKIHNSMQKLGKANSKTAPAERAKKERKRRKVTAQLVLDPNVEYNQLEASHSANILSLRHVICASFVLL